MWHTSCMELVHDSRRTASRSACENKAIITTQFLSCTWTNFVWWTSMHVQHGEWSGWYKLCNMPANYGEYFLSIRCLLAFLLTPFTHNGRMTFSYEIQSGSWSGSLSQVSSPINLHTACIWSVNCFTKSTRQTDFPLLYLLSSIIMPEWLGTNWKSIF